MRPQGEKLLSNSVAKTRRLEDLKVDTGVRALRNRFIMRELAVSSPASRFPGP